MSKKTTYCCFIYVEMYKSIIDIREEIKKMNILSYLIYIIGIFHMGAGIFVFSYYSGIQYKTTFTPLPFLNIGYAYVVVGIYLVCMGIFIIGFGKIIELLHSINQKMTGNIIVNSNLSTTSNINNIENL